MAVSKLNVFKVKKQQKKHLNYKLLYILISKASQFASNSTTNDSRISRGK